MAQLNPIDLRFNIPSVQQQVAQIKALTEKQSAEHTALLKRQETEQKQYGVNVGALRAKSLKEISVLETTHAEQKTKLLTKLADQERIQAEQTSRRIEQITKVRIEREQLAHGLGFKALEGEYVKHSKTVVDLKTKLSEENNKIFRTSIQNQIKDEANFTAVLRKEYMSREEVAKKGSWC